jgi:hypothetical protein
VNKNKIQCLIISNTLDYSTDLVCLALEKRNANYLRINRDQFEKFRITLDVSKIRLFIEYDNQEFIFENSSKNSIFFRAPVFIRTMNKSFSLEEQIYKSQWNSFIRNLIVFDLINWVNNPVDTYRAENKAFQLKKAKENGLEIPKTLITNTISNKIEERENYIVKSIDTALFNENGIEMFVYTNVVSRNELINSDLTLAPVFIQEYLKEKLDLRVTYISGELFPVEILSKNKVIFDDWRKEKKEELEYKLTILPLDIEKKIINLMKELKLEYGGIDLIKKDNKYYFIEVNPTGEWGWLSTNIKLRIEDSIVSSLLQLKKEDKKND